MSRLTALSLRQRSLVVLLTLIIAVAGFTVPFVRRIRGVIVAALGLLGISLLTRAA